jgi:hypothetical protein
MAGFSNQDIRSAIRTLREHTTRTLRVNLQAPLHAAKRLRIALKFPAVKRISPSHASSIGCRLGAPLA